MYTQLGQGLKRELPLILWVSLCLLAATALTRYIVVPRLASISQCAGLLAAYRQGLAGESAQGKLREEIEAGIGRLTQRVESITQGMGDPDDMSSLMNILIDQADKAGIEFVRVQPQHEVHDSNYIQYPVVLEMETGCHRLGSFTSLLESLPHLMRIDRLAATAKGYDRIDVRILCTCLLRRGKRDN